MLRRIAPLFRCATTVPPTPSRIERARLQEKIQNDRWRIIKNYRFNLSSNKQELDNFKENKDDPVYLDKCEIETRIMKRLYDGELIDLRKFSFNQDLRKDLKLDSLNIVVLLTEIEHEFTTVFEDRVFESVRNLSELVDILARDEKIF